MKLKLSQETLLYMNAPGNFMSTPTSVSNGCGTATIDGPCPITSYIPG